MNGSRFIFLAQRADTDQREIAPRVAEILDMESQAGMNEDAFYARFQARAEQVKNDFLALLLEAKRAGQTVAAYGAAAKGNTLLNFAGVRPDLLPYVVDKHPAKQGKFLPGSRIPIVAEGRLHSEQPDYIVILLWNIKDEIMEQLAYVREWGARFVTAVPRLHVK